MNSRSPRFVFLAVAAALVIGAAAGFAAHSLSSNKSATPIGGTHVVTPTQISSTSTTNSLTQIYAKDAPGVVTVTVTGRSAFLRSDPPSNPRALSSLGSISTNLVSMQT